MLVVGTASLLDTLDGAIADSGTAYLLPGYKPHALKPLLPVLTAAALLHASGKCFPNFVFVVSLPGCLLIHVPEV
jgi:hypothetical protein